MFKHEYSKTCRFKLFCRNKLCQFQHSTEDLEDINNKTDDLTGTSENVSAKQLDTAVNAMAQSFINDDNENDSDIEECDTCERTFKNNIDLNDHHRNDNCGFECQECLDCFKYENDLKLHQQKKCT